MCHLKTLLTDYAAANSQLVQVDIDCPKYLLQSVAKMFSITTSSSTSDFLARRLAHFRSRLRRHAQVSASNGVSTAAHNANSHTQSSADRMLEFSNEFIRFLSIDTLATESILRITETIGALLESFAVP